MQNNKIIIYLFVLLAIIQLAVPAVMIAKRELALEQGKPFKFETAPVDPYDAFRGRYVSLNFKRNYAPLNENLNLKRGQKVYACLKEDDRGFADIYKITLDPQENQDYLKAQVNYINSKDGKVYLELPFDRYYLEESVAKLAEKYYQEVNRTRTQDIASYVIVRVDSGFGVLEELYLEDEPIIEYVQERMEEEE
ncbi:MAG: GDYXXLXY domain-containing protein [Bacillota bacterium]